jgi:hypothetical protein
MGTYLIKHKKETLDQNCSNLECGAEQVSYQTRHGVRRETEQGHAPPSELASPSWHDAWGAVLMRLREVSRSARAC